ncbi:hypothetical protein Cfor_12754 [Coptotermes formosanus]|uniref:Uncharacterized protein n=1 Tax=Coptotermes formosanus TaxID=36987 RepID=A0A6L2PX78_COPFO|nr:hypothetical protein Cfor_12754 [Coptotermes formosanus]
MTSVDSGVDTGNDSNDSYATFDSQSTTREVGPVKLPTCVYPAPTTAKEVTEQGSGCVDMKRHRCDENSQFCRPLHQASPPLEVDPPAGLTFHNLGPSTLETGRGYEILESVTQRELQRKDRVSHLRIHRLESFITSARKRAAARRLRRAVSTNDVERVAALLADGADPNCVDGQQRSVLHLAACRGYCDIVRLLLERGANPNIKDPLGNTPLHLAACTNNIAVVTLLLKAGTHVDSTDHFGRSPLQLAQSKLRFLQRRLADTKDSQQVKDEAKQVVEMMLTYLDRCGQNPENELLRAFSSQLTLSHTQEEVETGVQDLLSSLESLSLEKSVSNQKVCTNKQ